MEQRAPTPLDSLAHAVAVVDAHGMVSSANAAWRRLVRRGTLALGSESPNRRRVTPPAHVDSSEPDFARSSPSPEHILAGWGALGESGWAMGEAIRSVLESRVSHARHEWIVRGAWQNRWLEMDVSAREHRGARSHVVVQVLDITRSKRAEVLRAIVRESACVLADSRWEQVHTVIARSSLSLVEWSMASRWEVRPRGTGFEAKLGEVWTPSGAVPSEGWNRVQKLDTDVVKRAAASGCPQVDESGVGSAPVSIALLCGVEDTPSNVLLLAAANAPTPGDLTDLGYLFQQAFTTDEVGLLTSGVEPVRLAACEREHVLQLLESASGNLRRVATWLGISRSTLYEKLRRYGIAYEGRKRQASDDDVAEDRSTPSSDESAA